MFEGNQQEQPTFLGLHSRDNASVILHVSSGIRQALGFAPSELVNKYSPGFIADDYDPEDYTRLVSTKSDQSEETEEAIDQEADAFVTYMNLNTASGTPVLARITSITCDGIVVIVGTAFPEVPFKSQAALNARPLDSKVRQLELEQQRRAAEQIRTRRRRALQNRGRSMYRTRSRLAKAVMLLENPDAASVETAETGRRPSGSLIVFCTSSISKLIEADNSDLHNYSFLKLVAPEDVLHVSRFFERMSDSPEIVFETFRLLQRPHVIEGDIFVSDEENPRVVVEALGAAVNDGVALLLRMLRIEPAPKKDTMGNYIRPSIRECDDAAAMSLAELVSSDPETTQVPESWSQLR
ncbi:hypothetical protein H4S02_005865 [Coemansia sp. RSA 2611]|nr:hypothetical protein H4S02_005865 [Coemansia sp. RSA 2611]